MKKTIKAFEKLLKKDNYTKEEVQAILLGTYEGFTNGIPKLRYEAKKKLWDDVEKALTIPDEQAMFNEFSKIKKKHIVRAC